MMMKAHNHLSDDQLIELCLGGGPLAAPGCPSCEARRARSGGAAARSVRRGRSGSGCSLPGGAARPSAGANPPAGRAGWPARPPHRVPRPYARNPRRCACGRPRAGLPAAAAAAFVIGLLAGHLAHDMPGRPASQPRTSCARSMARSRRGCAPSRRRSPRTSSSARSRWRRTAPARGRRCARCTT